MNGIFTSIRRTPYQSLAAFLVLFFTLFLSTGLFIILSFLHSLLGYVETRPQVTVYFQNTATEADIFKVRDELMDSNKIETVKYISKDEAFSIYKDLNKDNPLLLEMISSNIFPASLEISAIQPMYLPEVAEFLKKQPGVDEVQFQKDIFDKLLSLTTILRRTSLIMFGFLIFMSMVVLSTTTLFKIALKKDEIEILRLLGATNFYIKKPFLFESMFYGLTSAVLSFMIIVGTIYYFLPFLSGYMRGIPSLKLLLGTMSLTIWPLNPLFFGTTLALAIIFGVGIATTASYIASGRYLKS